MAGFLAVTLVVFFRGKKKPPGLCRRFFEFGAFFF